MLKGEWVISMSNLIDYASKYIDENVEGSGNIPYADLMNYLKDVEVLEAGRRVKEKL
jgi:hypothetical protein